MYLACVEIAAYTQPRVLQLEFTELEPAKVWAAEESSRRDDATGNAAVFETSGPLMVLAWERPEEAVPANLRVDRLPATQDTDRALLSA